MCDGLARELFFKRDRFGKLGNSFEHSETMVLDAQNRQHEARVTSVLLAEFKFIDWADLLDKIAKSETDQGREIMEKIRYKAYDDVLRDHDLLHRKGAHGEESEQQQLQAKALRQRGRPIEEYLQQTSLYSERKQTERHKNATVIQRHWRRNDVEPEVEEPLEHDSELEQRQPPGAEWRTERNTKKAVGEEEADDLGALRRDMAKVLTLLTDLDFRLGHTQRQVDTMFQELTEAGQRKRSDVSESYNRPSAPE